MGTVRSERQMNKPNMALRVAAVLLIMIVISTWMLSGMLAKYVATNNASDSARVASFDVSAAVKIGEHSEAVLDIGDEEAYVYYDFTLENNSEVAVACNIKVVMDKEPPAGIDMIMKDPDGDTMVIKTEKGKTEYVFVSGIKMKPDQTEVGTLTFTPGDVDYITFAQFAEGLTYTAEYPFKVGVTFIQID